jgi:tetratricopeptide (TPR) repeat protein
MLVAALAERGFDAFLDKTDIAPGEPWQERLAGLIATADTVVFSVSPDSVASPVCGWELEESARLGKRIIPAVARRIADAEAPPAIGRLNWVFLAEGDDKDAALASYQAMLAVVDRLAKADPGNAGWQVSLALSYDRVGAMQWAQGDLPAALTSYRARQAIFDRLTKSDPGNADWQSNLTATDDEVGYVQAALGDPSAALTSYQAGLDIMERLEKSDPGNANWPSGLAIAYKVVGAALFDLGRMEEALNNFNAAIQIGKAPDNSEIYWRRALAELYTKDNAAAADDAAMAVKLKPANPYNVIWLHIARARAGQNDADELAANAKALDRGKWPWPVVALFLDSATPDAARTAAASAEPSAPVGQSCEADFFIGVYLTDKGAQADARESLQSAADRCPNGYTQHEAATLELARLDAQAGTPAK